MKKNRPGTLVTVLARPGDRETLSALLFAETTTIGVRYQEMRRERLDRESRTIETPVGPIRFKVASRDGRMLNASPEFDDCARAGGGARTADQRRAGDRHESVARFDRDRGADP